MSTGTVIVITQVEGGGASKEITLTIQMSSESPISKLTISLLASSCSLTWVVQDDSSQSNRNSLSILVTPSCLLYFSYGICCARGSFSCCSALFSPGCSCSGLPATTNTARCHVCSKLIESFHHRHHHQLLGLGPLACSFLPEIIFPPRQWSSYISSPFRSII